MLADLVGTSLQWEITGALWLDIPELRSEVKAAVDN